MKHTLYHTIFTPSLKLLINTVPFAPVFGNL
nr:MAG TPA: hypothetical protein [Caudoviricetes sp.]